MHTECLKQIEMSREQSRARGEAQLEEETVLGKRGAGDLERESTAGDGEGATSQEKAE